MAASPLKECPRQGSIMLGALAATYGENLHVQFIILCNYQFNYNHGKPQPQ